MTSFLWPKNTIFQDENRIMIPVPNNPSDTCWQVSEAMKAQSQAFVTEDGTAVKKNEKVCSYFAIALRTVSILLISSMTYKKSFIKRNVFVNLNSIA